MIKYINISLINFDKLSYKEKKENSYCIDAFFTKVWRVKNVLHREDGPAVIWINGSKHWYLNNIEYSFEEWLKFTSISNEEKVFLRLKYGKN